MKTFDKLNNKHYVKSDYALDSFVESFYGDEELNKKLQSMLTESGPIKKAVDAAVDVAASAADAVVQTAEEIGKAVDNVPASDEQEETEHTLQHLDRIILIGEMRYKSLYSQEDITLDYCDPTKLEYTLDENKIHVFDGEYKFDVVPEDAANSIVLVRSGYKNPVVAFLLDEIMKMGVTVFNDPAAVNITNNKYLTALMLSKYNLPQPKYCLVSHDDIHKGDHKKLDKKLKTIYNKYDDDTKFVCKILGGHGGQGVFLCTGFNIESVLQAIFAIKEDTLILVQECENIKDGDVRAHVLTVNGKQEILNVAMRTKGKKDFRTNLSLGNSMKDYVLTQEQEQLVCSAAKASGLAWCGVDLLPLENGQNVILELNGAPGPPSEIQGDDLEGENEKFWKSFIDTVNKLCE